MVLAKKLFLEVFSRYKFIEANDMGMTSLDPGGMDGRIYVGYHYALLLTIHINFGPQGF